MEIGEGYSKESDPLPPATDSGKFEVLLVMEKPFPERVQGVTEVSEETKVLVQLKELTMMESVKVTVLGVSDVFGFDCV